MSQTPCDGALHRESLELGLVGYADELSVAPGDELKFMVSSAAGDFQADVVRLRHGDSSDAGPGVKYDAVESDVTGVYPGVHQKLRPGSYARIPMRKALGRDGGFTVQMRIWPTTPDGVAQTLMAYRTNDWGFALGIDQRCLTLRLGSEPDECVRLTTACEPHRWYSVAAGYAPAEAEALLSLKPLDPTASDGLVEIREQVRVLRQNELPESAGAIVLLGAESGVDGDVQTVGNFYNGKIEAPCVFARMLCAQEVRELHSAKPVRRGIVAKWDFSLGIDTNIVRDVSGNGLSGEMVNKPTRGMTGANWDGSESAWPRAPEQYGAIHFHDDDLDDAGWDASIVWRVPEKMRSGMYALRTRVRTLEDFIPFVVRPGPRQAKAKVALLVPTFTYLAYANEHLLSVPASREALLSGYGHGGTAVANYPCTPHDEYIVANRLNSLYDVHTDGSGVCYASQLRPLVNMRPSYRDSTLDRGEGAPHGLGADLHLIDWLYELDYSFDTVSDGDLHREGVSLLRPYNVIMTGSHPEYWSHEMLSAAQQYVCEGGRLMYLGANGMYWVTQVDAIHGHGIEVRRVGPATRSWDAQPGEAYLSATGELGGLWRYRGAVPQTWLGVGFTAQGSGLGRPYDRQPDSYRDDVAWVWSGVAEQEQIGDFPSLAVGYGAAGVEIDRADHALGTPRRTAILATASGFSDAYQHVAEEVWMSDSAQGGSDNAKVRADMVLVDYPNGGAVFSTGSIGWCACLSYNNYDNNVARITLNVLDKFSSDH